jgi:hypothetical protein
MARPFRTAPSPALHEILERDEANGVDVFDHGPPTPAPGPAERVEPLLPVLIPPPQWREEEAERAKRQAADEPVESEQSLNPTPAKPKRRDGPKPTPNLDKVKAWMEDR